LRDRECEKDEKRERETEERDGGREGDRDTERQTEQTSNGLERERETTVCHHSSKICNLLPQEKGNQ
jgi:hypothetical protein